MTQETLLSRIYDAIWPSKSKTKSLSLMNMRLESFLRTVPLEYCGWSHLGVQAISPKFIDLLDVDEIDTIEDIQSALTAGDAAALEGVYERLIETGESFDLIARSEDEEKVFKIFGRQGTVTDKEEIFDVLWVQDITQEVKDKEKSKRDLGKAKDKENQFKTVLNTLPIPVWLRDENLDLAWCNKSYAQILNETTATVIADKRELPTSTQSKDRKRVKGSRILAQNSLRDGKPVFENMHLVIDGERRLVQVNEAPIVDHNVVGHSIDITRVEDLEAEMKHFQDSNNEVLEQLRTAISIYNTDRKIEFYNLAFEQLWGLDGKWLNEKPNISEILDKLRENRSLPEQADFKHFKSKWVDRFTSLLDTYEEMLYLPDERVLRMVIIPRPRGGLIVTYEDVTSRLELESSYNTLIDVQQETLDNLAEGLVVFGEDGRLKLFNPTYALLWDLQPEELESMMHISALVEKTKKFFDAENWEDIKSEMITNALDRTSRRGRIQRIDGSCLEYSIIPLPDGNILNAYFDITDTAKVEQALLEKNEALEEAERLKLDFLANVSYQLRTPLNAIVGFTDILDQQYFGDLNEKQLGYTKGMKEAGQKLVTLIDDILDLSTIDAGYMDLNIDEVDIKALIAKITDITEEWARKQNIKLSVDYGKNIPTLFCDEQRIKQVVLNLLHNAIRFTEGAGKINIKLAHQDDMMQIIIADTGVGIPESDLTRVFSPFERGGGEFRKRNVGAGIGLSLVKSIIDLHHGHVLIESKEGKGTTVTCQIPTNLKDLQKEAKQELLPA